MMIWNNMMFNSPSTYLMETLHFMNDYITMFLSSLLLSIIMLMIMTGLISKFNLEFLDNHEVEMIWTLTPSIILLLIAIPCLNCLYSMDSCLFCGLNIKIMGNQWYWSYQYCNFNNLNFDSYMMKDSTLRLLNTDNNLILPLNTPIRMMISSTDVIHSWTIPSTGIKMDAIPGRMNQFCFSIKKVGMFFGQCSEICGANHSFMPIVMECVPMKMFMHTFN